MMSVHEHWTYYYFGNIIKYVGSEYLDTLSETLKKYYYYC